MERAYMNRNEGFVTCCWNAPDRESVETLFKNAGAPYEKIIEVEEYEPDSFAS